MKKLFLAVYLSIFALNVNATPIYEFVGSWFVGDGPQPGAKDQNGHYTTKVFSGIEAAAYIFGGEPEDYAISTISDKVDEINFRAWMDGWGDPISYGLSGKPAPQDLHKSRHPHDLYYFGTYGQTYSAYVADSNLRLENFAFRIVKDNAVSVSEPGSLILLGIGLLCLVISRRKKVFK